MSSNGQLEDLFVTSLIGSQLPVSCCCSMLLCLEPTKNAAFSGAPFLRYSKQLESLMTSMTLMLNCRHGFSPKAGIPQREQMAPAL